MGLRTDLEALLARLEAWDGSDGINNPDSSSGTERARLRQLLADNPEPKHEARKPHPATMAGRS